VESPAVKYWFRVIIVLLAAAPLPLVALGPAAPQPAAPGSAADCSEATFCLTADEALLLRVVNAERKEHGLEPLEFNRLLTEVARRHSGDMATRGYFSHIAPEPRPRTPLDRFAAALGHRPDESTVIGENIGRAREPVMGMIHEAMMESPEHRANILDAEYSQLGVGIRQFSDGRIWVTELYRGTLAQTR
jgi:uncharacterized protein YkwD